MNSLITNWIGKRWTWFDWVYAVWCILALSFRVGVTKEQSEHNNRLARGLQRIVSRKRVTEWKMTYLQGRVDAFGKWRLGSSSPYIAAVPHFCPDNSLVMEEHSRGNQVLEWYRKATIGIYELHLRVWGELRFQHGNKPLWENSRSLQ